MSNTSDNALNVYVGQPGLQVSYNAGNLYISGSLVSIAAGTIAVTKNTTNYIYLLFSNNTVTANTSGFPAASFPMATVVVDNERPTTLTDSRADFVTPVSDQGTFVADVFESGTVNPASAGVLRLAKSDAIKWRNNANGADVAISLNSSDEVVLPKLSLTGQVSWAAATSISGADILDFSNVTRASGYKFIRIGTYSSPVPWNTTGVFHAYTLDTGNGSAAWLFFHLLRGTGSDELIGEQLLIESESVTNPNYPSNLKGHDVLVGLTNVSSHLATVVDHTSGMFGGHFKIYSVDGATVAAGARAACLWLDGQMNGANAAPVAANYYNIYNTSGGNKYEAFAKLHLISGEGAGWRTLFEFNFTNGTDPLVASTVFKAPDTTTPEGGIRCDRNGTDIYIPYYLVA